jgi:hypothetical protein
VIRSFFRCLLCGHVTPHRAGPRGIVAHTERFHEARGRFEHTEPAPGHAVLKRRYTDAWEYVDLTGADIDVECVYVTRSGEGPWTLLIGWPEGDVFLHGEWRTQRTAKDKRFELRKIGRTGQTS